MFDIQFQFKGLSDFMFSMEELTDAWRTGMNDPQGTMANKEVYVEAITFDWFRHESYYGWATTVVHGNEVYVKVLGDRSRTFKPHRPFTVYVSIIYILICFILYYNLLYDQIYMVH